MMEWSTTKSTGTSGSIFCGFCPNRRAWLRIAARSASRGTPGKSCNNTRATTEGNFILAVGRGRTTGQLPHMLGSDLAAIAVAQHRFEHDADRYRQAPDGGKLPGQRGQTIESALFARRRFENPQQIGKRVPGGRWRSGRLGR